MAWDVTERSRFLTHQLNRWIYDGKATKLFHEKDVFCYVIVPSVNQCSLFKHVCPNPHLDSEEDCGLCGQYETCEKINNGK